jgi:hypothetical protein
MSRAGRNELSNCLVVAAYAVAAASLLTFGMDVRVWLGELAIWLAAVVGALVAYWRRGIVALPSALLAFAYPAVFVIVFWNGGLG